MIKNLIAFDRSARDFVLDVFDKAVDAEGYIVEKRNPSQRVLTPAGECVRAENFAGVRKGSLIFFNSDLPSLVALSDCIR